MVDFALEALETQAQILNDAPRVDESPGALFTSLA